MASESAKSAKVSEQISQFRELLDYVEHGIINKDPTVVGILVAVVLVLLTMLLLLFRSKSSQRRGVLLVGLCDSGKTLIFSRLIHSRFVNTHTSIKENVGFYKTAGKNNHLQLVDLPGHERLLSQMLDQYKATARAVIFVVDSLTFQKDVKDVAELLYTVLTDNVLLRTMLLIACNKQDMTLSKGGQTYPITT
ncbi:Signal recognition particle receptor subunit beta [Lamellibrachia satsuma]|nr:Signal recognition particle receptor subunit beta [Lamellibrachia satsuma]